MAKHKCAVYTVDGGRRSKCPRDSVEFIKLGRKKIGLCDVHHTLNKNGRLSTSRKIAGIDDI